MAKLAEGIRIVDADSHMTERHDLFTERAPKGYEDKVPHVEKIDGVDMWVLDGHTLRQGRLRWHHRPRRQEAPVHATRRAARGASTTSTARRGIPTARLELMDEFGIDAQVLYPNAIGLGGQNLVQHGRATTSSCCCASSSTTTRMAEFAGGVEQPPRPDADHAGVGHRGLRAGGAALRRDGIPRHQHDLGPAGLRAHPTSATPSGIPLWEVCADLHLPVHFHIGASQTSLSYFGTTYWPSQDDYVKPAIGGASLFQNNSRVLLNSAYSGMFDRHPELKMVSVESGIGWIPFMLEAMDYELEENAPEHAKKLKKLPSEYFRDNWYATFWFENGRGDLQHLIDTVGEDNIMFETDFPHPTCLYPTPLETVEEKIATLRPETQRKVMGDNAIELYRLAD